MVFKPETESFGRKRRRGRGLVLILGAALFPDVAFGQRCTEAIPDTSYTVRGVQVEGRWVPDAVKQEIKTLIPSGSPFRNSRVSAAVEMVSSSSKAAEDYFPPRLAGAIGVSYTHADFCAVSGSPKLVDVVIHPHFLRIDFFQAGRNLLPVPRSPHITFYEAVPKALLALSPVVGFATDERYGPSASLETETDLLHLSNPSKGPKQLRLTTSLEARKSITEPFYTAGGRLQLDRPGWNSTALGWNVGAGFLKKVQPLAGGRQDLEDFSLQASLQRSPNSAVVKKWMAGASFRSLNNQFDTLAGKRANADESGYRLLWLSDFLVRKNLARFGLWFDQGFLQNSRTDYKQVSARGGYRFSFLRKADSHQSVDLDLLAGTGKIWGDAPAYARFYAGNTGGGFLFQAFGSRQLQDLPGGPVIRSIGERRGSLSPVNTGIKGGTAYWHFNLNLSIPIRPWSRPLIPDMVVDSERGTTLQSKLRSLAKGSAESGVAVDLIDNKGFPDNAQTDSMAKEIVAKEILPMITFVTDRANVVAFKPLLLFDAGGLKAQGLSNRTYTAVGAGFQLTVVIAHLQVGYMRTLSPSVQKGGNFWLQLLFQNFF